MILALLVMVDTPLEQTAYWDCLTHATVRLERSGERPRDVAAAALDVCRKVAPAEWTPAFRLAMHDPLIERLADRVVEIRAARH